MVYGDKLPIGKILESLNVKGYRVGNIGMRATHANIMVNYGGGTYLEAITVVKNLQDMVKEKWEIDIEPEVRFMPADFREFWR